MARPGPAGGGREAPGKGLGAPEGPSILLLGPPAPASCLPPARLAAPPRRAPRPPPEPDAVSATSSSAPGRGPQRVGRAPRPAPRPHATLLPGPRRGGPGRFTPRGWARRGPPGARTAVGPPAAQSPARSGVWAALELCKVLNAAFVAGGLRRGLLSRISASSPYSSTNKT